MSKNIVVRRKDGIEVLALSVKKSCTFNKHNGLTLEELLQTTSGSSNLLQPVSVVGGGGWSN